MWERTMYERNYPYLTVEDQAKIGEATIFLGGAGLVGFQVCRRLYVRHIAESRVLNDDHYAELVTGAHG